MSERTRESIAHGTRPNNDQVAGWFCPLWKPGLVQQRVLRGKAQTNAIGELEKACSSCKEFWPADTEFFYPQSSARDGLHTWCKACYLEWRYPERYQAEGIGHAA